MNYNLVNNILNDKILKGDSFSKIIIKLFEYRQLLDIDADYGNGLPINPYCFQETSRGCEYCNEGFSHDYDWECDIALPLDNPYYVFGIGPDDGDYGILTWDPKTFTLQREGSFQWMGKATRVYNQNTPINTVLENIKQICITSGPQYSDEVPFPEDAFVVIPKLKKII